MPVSAASAGICGLVQRGNGLKTRPRVSFAHSPCRLAPLVPIFSFASHFDFIIVGAGPAGSNAASVALNAGLRVAQIDAAVFPRVKPCAGGVTLKAAASLQQPLDPSVRESFTAVEFNLWGRRRSRFVHPDVVLRTVCRPEFDNRLVQANLSRPDFTFMPRHRVRNVSYDGRFTVNTSAGTVTATQLIAADGAYSVVNRVFESPRRARPRPLSESYSAHRARGLAQRRALLRLRRRGAGLWMGVSEGRPLVRRSLHAVAADAPNIRQHLVAYLRSKGLSSGDRLPEGLMGFRVPVGGFRYVRRHARSMLPVTPAGSPMR